MEEQREAHFMLTSAMRSRCRQGHRPTVPEASVTSVQEQAVTTMACRWPCVTRGGARQFRLQFLFFYSPLHASAGFKENEGRQYWEKGTASESKLAFRGGIPDLDGGIHCMKLAFIVLVACPKLTMRHAMPKT